MQPSKPALFLPTVACGTKGTAVTSRGVAQNWGLLPATY